MEIHLKHNNYGKSSVRLTKVVRSNSRHELIELTVDTLLEGEFEDTHITGDNAKVLPTDTQKNTVYAIARNHPIDCIESFAETLARHFVGECGSHIRQARVNIRQQEWARMNFNGREEDTAFQSTGGEQATTSVVCTREELSVRSGLTGLLVLKTTNSAFVGYQCDKFTTLKETGDRIFATSITADWLYRSPGRTKYDEARKVIRTALLRTFAKHKSLSVQQTLYEMGKKALEECDAISEIHLALPNSHRHLVDLQPFGMDNPNLVFLPTSEPYGLIEATLTRD
ncbi:urate oxidase [Candidatus Sumerlaeota bacterium]|nr:urate oxidase [Candidatus Sumerlaeota bacterium]